ncbi:organic cation transporter protein-like isoform X2 [Apostichopus japonicus]|uniref:organic cation transporter protein-like isoform X2 n=1 Tax=Stichopus japonicus TaxID=307972 RepID=UPI003AB593D3
MKFDEVLGLIGEMGPYQILIMSLVAMAMIPEAMHSLIAVFLTANMDHWCAVPEWAKSFENCTSLPIRSTEYLECIHQYRDASIPVTHVTAAGNPVYSQCQIYDTEYPTDFSDEFFAGDAVNSTRGCPSGWIYDQSQYKSTIVNDFDIVCGDKHLAFTSQSIFYFGYLIGSWASGSLADIIGRYYTFFIAVTVDLIAGFVMSFANSFWMFCLFRFIVGVANISLYIMAFVIATEILGPSKRAIGGISAPTFFSVGYMLLALLAFLVRDWRYLQRIASACLLPLYLLIPILPESARWLMAHQKFDKAEEIIKKIAKHNKTEDKLPEGLTESLMKEHEEKNKEKTYTSLDILRQPRLRIAAFILFFVWPVSSLVYFGLSLNTAKFGSNDYVTFFLTGAVEIPANLLIIPLIGSPLGRKFTISGAMYIGSIACLTTILTSGAIKTTAAMIGKFFITISFSTLYIMSAEIFPTTVRSIGVGMCSTSSRVGSILAPIVLIMADLWEPLPLVVFAVLEVIAATCLLLLPETRGKILTATLAESENFLRSRIGRCGKGSKGDIQLKDETVE